MNKPYRSWFPRSQGLLLDLNELTTNNDSAPLKNRVCKSTMKQFEKITNPLCRTLMTLLMLAFTLASHAAVESITYITTDHLGSPIMATDQSGAVLWREDYLPYGVQLEQEDEDSSVGFTGHLDEKTLDVTYMQGRWYHPEVGRFLAIDPVGFVEGNPMSFNRYAYANNNPYKYIDPDGRWIEDALLGIPSIIVGADSFSTNIENGNFFDAAVDVAGMIYDVAATATPGVPGGAGLSILVSRKAAGEVSEVAKEANYLYRGVSASHPEIEAAKAGTVIPGNLNGTVSAEAHNLGGHAANSPFTSWTRDPSIAATHAAKDGAGGVVLRVPEGTAPPGASWSWEWSPDVWGESEVLMRGMREGAEVLK